MMRRYWKKLAKACHISQKSRKIWPSLPPLDVLQEHSIGRPKFNITREQIQHLLELHFSCPKIACLIGVSLRTIRRRMAEYELSVSNFYANISDEELERQVNEIRVIYPNCGYRMMDGHLRQRGIRITQSRIRNTMHKVDPDGVVQRWRDTIRRRKYRVSGPIALWHIDGNHKLIRYSTHFMFMPWIMAHACSAMV